MNGLKSIDFDRRELSRGRFHNPEAPLDVRLLIATGAIEPPHRRPSLVRRIVRLVQESRA